MNGVKAKRCWLVGIVLIIELYVSGRKEMSGLGVEMKLQESNW